jgi:hypothetical protein
MMNLKPIQIELNPSDVQKILSIAMDEDKDGAMEFIKQTLAKRVEKALQRH